MPPLRQRREDILLLFEYFALRAAERYRREVPALSAEGVGALHAHRWPGNVRDLKNVAERYVLSSLPAAGRIAALLHPGDLGPFHPVGRSLAEQTGHFERCLIEQTLRRHQGNIQEVLAELDLPRRTLNLKMQSHGLLRKNYLDEKS